jgi:ABC-type uncharacterized transport system substrate-binding protein
MKRILAVAVGQDNSASFPNPITNVNPTNVRPYILGLIDGLWLGYGASIGGDYDIWYRVCPIAGISGAFGPGSDNRPNDLIFPMSTRVTANAIQTGITKPIVFPTGSNFQQDIAKKLPKNVAGINAQRDQGDKLLDYFKQAWPSLQTLHYLHLQGYGPSDRASGAVVSEAAHRGIHCHPGNVTDATLAAQLASLPNADGNTGLLVLPIDFCIGEGPQQAPSIIQVAQVQKGLPTFFPIPDWAYQTASAPTPAFGAYGVSQYNCGRLASDLVYHILWQGLSPASLGIVPAPNSLFDLVVNQTAADELRIGLPDTLQRHVSRGGEVNASARRRDRATGPSR